MRVISIMSVLDFSKRLNYLMQTEKISQRYLSNQTGLQRKSILNWLNAKFYPRYDALITLADFFCQCTDYIVGISDDESKIVGPIKKDVESIPIRFASLLNKQSNQCKKVG